MRHIRAHPARLRPSRFQWPFSDLLKTQNILFKDLGTYSKDSVDYPTYAEKVAKSIQIGESKFGILFCGTGIGVSIAANKFKSIRAALCTNEFCAEMARRHNNANVLCLGGRVIDNNTAISLVKIFLKTPFDGNRHERRINQIKAIENSIGTTN